MKLLHLSDLHIGKKVNGFSMMEDQRHILAEILRIVRMHRPQAIAVAGDIYDKSLPAGEAVQLFDRFLTDLAAEEIPLFLISGNHDAPERIAFGARIMEARKVHFSPVYSGQITPIVLEDDHGEVAFYLLPFLKPVHVRRFFPEAKVETYDEAIALALSHMEVDTGRRNVLVAHQFVTGALRSESEEVTVGGVDNVDAARFEAFDYVALGHLHRPQAVGRETLRYCGSPLKYSFSEAAGEKSVTLAHLGAKGRVKVETLPLRPLRELETMRGTYMEVTDRNFYKERNRQVYLRVTLTDEEDVPDAMNKLRTIYPNIMRLEYDNSRTGARGPGGGEEEAGAMEQGGRSPLQILESFYELQNNGPMSHAQRDHAAGIIEKIWEGSK